MVSKHSAAYFDSVVSASACDYEPSESSSGTTTTLTSRGNVSPGVLTTADILAREYRRWLALPEVMFVIACAPCRIVATPGRQLGVGDADAYVTTDATSDVADHFQSPFVIGENHTSRSFETAKFSKRWTRGTPVAVAIARR